MTRSSDPQKCHVKWCDEPAQHLGVHRCYLGEVMFTGWQTVTSINITVETSHTEPQPRLVLTVAATRPSRYSAAALNWDQVTHLTAILTAANTRWGT